MSLENQSNAFTANLYVKGIPVVLNQQRLKVRQLDPRMTRRERLDVEVALASNDSASTLTLADHEDDKPLLLKFVPKADKYEIVAVLRGVYGGNSLKVNPETHHLYVSNGSQGSEFSICKYGVERAVFDDLGNGPVYIQLVSELNGRPLYLAGDKGDLHFKDVNPNNTKHDAYNNEPVNFVIKIVGKPGEERA
ncbi:MULTISPECIES: hypothetical protein [Pseudomonas]|uniref:Alginate biosynthesis protein AlgF n=1 Tax=Pseudomonas wuhanensis TaxID=2954098 RepID=A0ABY9GU58_9PSED|nr:MULTISPECIES: hypothetical protein [unclassified Pseudomonas]WLI13293.1 hypothetical protein PSH65_03760 [Pseudomonas sp. FP603]WLI19178.1 hypothetical protein PSH88_03765 [Pseudomonas sp. FP607]